MVSRIITATALTGTLLSPSMAGSTDIPTLEQCVKPLEINEQVRQRLEYVAEAKRQLLVGVALFPIEEQERQIAGMEKIHTDFKRKLRAKKLQLLKKHIHVPAGMSDAVAANLLERYAQKCEQHYGAIR